MINYIEKGQGLHERIVKRGHRCWHKDGVALSDNDVKVQKIIDEYDPLPYEKKKARQAVKAEAARRAAEVYPFIDPEKSDAEALFKLINDLYRSVKPASRNGLKGGLLDLDLIKQAKVDAVAVINAMTDWKEVLSYDPINTPIWPE